MCLLPVAANTTVASSAGKITNSGRRRRRRRQADRQTISSHQIGFTLLIVVEVAQVGQLRVCSTDADVISSKAISVATLLSSSSSIRNKATKWRQPLVDCSASGGKSALINNNKQRDPNERRSPLKGP